MGSPQRVARATELRRWAALVLTAVLSALLVADYAHVPTGPVHEGDVAERTVKAPFSFSYQDHEAHALARARAVEATPPVFLYDEGLSAELASLVSGAFQEGRDALGAQDGTLPEDASAAEVRDVAEQLASALSIPEKAALGLTRAGFPIEAEIAVVDWLEQAYGERLVLADRRALPDPGRALTVVPRVGDRESFALREHERIAEPEAVRRSVTLAALKDRAGQPWHAAAETAALALVRPNLAYDAERTTLARAEAEAGVMLEPVVVKRGETLFREGDKITSIHVMMYQALQSSRSDHGVMLEVVVTSLFFVVLLGSLYVGVRRHIHEDDAAREILAVGGVLVMTALLARIVVSSAPGVADWLGNDALPESVWFLVPVAGGAMLVRVLMGFPAAGLYTLAATGICAVLMRLDALYVVYFILTSLVAAASVEHVRERIAVLKAGLWTGGFGALVVFLLHFVELYAGDGELSLANQVRPFWSMLFALVGGFLSGCIVLAVLPIFENMGFVTDHRMLELASLNHPLLRQLMLRAPGTYHHSVVVGTLAEAACEAIGANSLQAKISAYFHDIGKALQPRFFVENQRGGANPHNDLDPGRSADVIIRHVTEGARLAREHRLPKPILDNILMHHGTGLLQYFFAKAQMEADDPVEVEEVRYRYPGPKPDTREAGVIMLADKVEAATRTIKHPTEENVRAMINRIINSVIADHQFTECPLTFQEIHTIADTFVTVLMGIHHQRIEYPQTSGISQAGAQPAPVVADHEPGRIAGRVGTITLELESRALAAGGGGRDLWNEEGERTDENTDYESVRNLPQGDL